jgi:hypothetical protein
MNEMTPTAVSHLIQAYKKMNISGDEKLSMGRLFRHLKSSQQDTSVASKASGVSADVISHEDVHALCQIKSAYIQSKQKQDAKECELGKTRDAAIQAQADMATKLNLGSGKQAVQQLQTIMEFHEMNSIFCEALAEALKTDVETVKKIPSENIDKIFQESSNDEINGFEDLKAMYKEINKQLQKLEERGFDISNFSEDFQNDIEKEKDAYFKVKKQEDRAQKQLKKLSENKKKLASIGDVIQKWEKSTGQILGEGAEKKHSDHSAESVTSSLQSAPQVKVQKITPKVRQAVYSLAHGKALLVKNETGYTIALKVSQDRYVKFRNPMIVDKLPKQAEKNDWLAVGNPAVFYIYREDLMQQVQDFTDSKYGDYGETGAAFLNFLQDASAQIEERAVSNTSLKDGKLAVEMNEQGEFRIVERKAVGKGSTKEVFEQTVYQNTPTSEKFARARIGKKESAEDESSLEAMRQEFDLSSYFRANGVPNILEIKMTHGQNLNKVRLHMPLAKSDLEAVITALADGPITKETRKKFLLYLLQAALALQGMHLLGYVHNDFKLGNLLLDKEHDCVKVSDFGMCEVVDEPTLASTFPAPERAPDTNDLKKKMPGTFHNDCWAFGLAMYSMLHGKEGRNLTHEAHFSNGKEAIEAKAKTIVTTLQDNDPADQLIKELLNLEPSKRPTMGTVVKTLQEILKKLD